MQQLAPRDAFFVSSETPQHPSHIGGLCFLNPMSRCSPSGIWLSMVHMTTGRARPKNSG